MTTRRLLATLASLAVAAVTLTGCGPSGSDSSADGPVAENAAYDPNATIGIGSLYEPTSLSNVAGAGQGLTEAFYGNVYEALFKLNDDGSVTNALADKATTSDDGRTITITLVDGVKFHSGKSLTSADVVASYERAIADDAQGSRKSIYKSSIASVTAPDASTVVFQLVEPWISFEYDMTYLWIVNTDAGDLKETEDGTGPYVFEGWVRGNSISLKRSNDYWGPAATNGEIVFHYFTDASALSNALLSGEIDVIAALQSPDTLSQFEGNDDYVVNDSPSTTKELLAFNDHAAPFDDTRVRRAIYSAIDRKKLLESIWGDHGMLVGSMVPPTDAWYVDLNAVNPYDPELSKKLLAEAGHADGFEFVLDTPTYDPHPAVAEFVKSELAKVGVTVDINLISADEWYSRVYEKHDFVATLQEHVNDRDLAFYARGRDMYFEWDDADFIRLFNESEHAATLEDQTAKLVEANTLMAHEAASVWLYLYPQIVVSSADVTGYPLHGLNSQFYASTIQKSERG
ncbi:ABC transporter substrate-binding protein [Xylanimonas ulmi]|uniref:Peptide/nickel transport system substrate-binding protein n=1 Tax=Xylanimonas ulmi TaxID=228973 RepID=A0A4Q7M438_9MICO|nr:ABC transporter substrate-binding protein [Xylanibacterium ulmi]RZS60739.1 peptide/nickel transport system substrate-binding protein [Xylanibacterium ulmi]